MAQAAQAVVLPVPVEAPAAPVAPKADDGRAEPSRDVTPPPVAPAAPVAPVVAANSDEPAAAPPVTAVPAPAPELIDIHEEIDFMPPRPDDPGPDAFDEEDEDRRASW